jgi:hypothetical protein
MTDSSNSRAVNELIARSGILKQLADEDAARRSAQHADLRQRKAAALAAFQKQKPVADAAVAAADKKADDARKLADQALQDYIAARAKLDTVYGTLSGTVDPIDREMRTCCDPAIDAFKAELEQLRTDTPALHRNTQDPNGPYTDLNGNKFRDNRFEVQARVVAISDALGAADRLKIDPNVDDVPAAIDAIRKSIPEA